MGKGRGAWNEDREFVHDYHVLFKPTDDGKSLVAATCEDNFKSVIQTDRDPPDTSSSGPSQCDVNVFPMITAVDDVHVQTNLVIRAVYGDQHLADIPIRSCQDLLSEAAMSREDSFVHEAGSTSNAGAVAGISCCHAPGRGSWPIHRRPPPAMSGSLRSVQRKLQGKGKAVSF